MASTAPHIRIGTRGSDLALWQAHHVRDLLQARGATAPFSPRRLARSDRS